MSRVLLRAPVGVPVYRMEVELAVRDLGSALALAVADLAALDTPPDVTAGLLGCPLSSVLATLAAIRGDGGRRRRIERVWVDPAHGSVLGSDQALALLPRAHHLHLPLAPVTPPTANALSEHEVLRAVNLLDGVRRGRVEVDEILDLRPSNFAHHDDHLLSLAGAELVVMVRGETLVASIEIDGQADPMLNDAAKEALRFIDAAAVSIKAQEQAAGALRAHLGLQEHHAPSLGLEGAREATREVLDAAVDRIAVALPAGLRPSRWLLTALREAAQDVDVQVSGGPPRLSGLGGATRFDGSNPTAPILIADDDLALAHTASLALGGPWSLSEARAHTVLRLEGTEAVRPVLARLGVPPLSRLKPASSVSVEAWLRESLSEMRAELGVEPEDDLPEADLAVLRDRRRRYRGDARVRGLRSLVNGVTWERALFELVLRSTTTTSHLRAARLRWLPSADVRLDIDVAVTDSRDSGRIWLIDAKHGEPRDEDLASAHRQCELVRRTGHGLDVRALVIHRQLDESPPVTVYTDVERGGVALLRDRLAMTV